MPTSNQALKESTKKFMASGNTEGVEKKAKKIEAEIKDAEQEVKDQIDMTGASPRDIINGMFEGADLSPEVMEYLADKYL